MNEAKSQKHIQCITILYGAAAANAKNERVQFIDDGGD